MRKSLCEVAKDEKWAWSSKFIKKEGQRGARSDGGRRRPPLYVTNPDSLSLWTDFDAAEIINLASGKALEGR
jgi:hypothetical protein